MRIHGKIIFRVDGDDRIGAGHVIRCLALTQAWQDAGGESVFVASCLSDVLESRLIEEGMAVRRISVDRGSAADAEASASVARDQSALYIVADGYFFGIEYQQFIKDAGFKLLVVDDNGENGSYCCDILLNQNAYANEDLYRSREAYTRLCLGSSYALLRREFRDYIGWERVVPDLAGKILVTLGGGDFIDLTCSIVGALRAVLDSKAEVRVISGGSISGLEKLESLIKSAGTRFSLHCNVSNMAEYIAWADMSISAAGSTCWEQAFMGLPSVTVVVADNQEQIAGELVNKGFSRNIGYLRGDALERMLKVVCELVSDKDSRISMAKAGRSLVDGKGVERVVAHMVELL